MKQGGFAQRAWEAYKDLEKREGKVSQSELARRIERHGGHPTRQDDVSRWFRGTSRPEFEELPAIAEVLGIDLMVLTFGEDARKAKGAVSVSMPTAAERQPARDPKPRERPERSTQKAGAKRKAGGRKR